MDNSPLSFLNFESYGKKLQVVKEIATNIKKTGFAYSTTARRMKSIEELTSNVTEREVALYPGCTLTTFFSKSVFNFVRALLKSGLNIVVPSGLRCCGYPFTVVGNIDDAIKSVYENDKILSMYQNVVFACPECYKVFKENEDYINFTPVFVSEYMYGLLKKGLIKPTHSVFSQDRFLAIHDPCVSGRFILDHYIVRKTLSELGFKYGSPKASGYVTECCGFGGLYPSVDEKDAIKISKKRMDDLLKISNSIITTCPACMLAFDRVAKLSKMKVDVLHLMDLVE